MGEAGLGIKACVLVPIKASVPPGDNDILVPETVTTPPGVNVCVPKMYWFWLLAVSVWVPSVRTAGVEMEGRSGDVVRV